MKKELDHPFREKFRAAGIPDGPVLTEARAEIARLKFDLKQRENKLADIIIMTSGVTGLHADAVSSVRGVMQTLLKLQQPDGHTSDGTPVRIDAQHVARPISEDGEREAVYFRSLGLAGGLTNADLEAMKAVPPGSRWTHNYINCVFTASGDPPANGRWIGRCTCADPVWSAALADAGLWSRTSEQTAEDRHERARKEAV